MARSKEGAIIAYVAAQRELDVLQRQDPADIVDFERALKLKKALVKVLYGQLSGGQLGEARRRLTT